jgi:hypothetical protein
MAQRTPESLSKKELNAIKTWARNVEREMAKMPAGLGLYTIGDRCINVYLEQDEETPIHDGAACHLTVTWISTPVCVEGTTG